jgi:hypothetical protein
VLLASARVRIEAGDGYVWIDDEAPAIVLVEAYYRHGSDLDLYLDLLQELTHLQQHAEGHACGTSATPTSTGRPRSKATRSRSKKVAGSA